MADVDRDRRARATAIFKLALKASSAGIHRTMNRPPKGKGWVQGVNCPPGLIALAYEMLGEFDSARSYFTKMREQAAAEKDDSYTNAAELGLSRLR